MSIKSFTTFVKKNDKLCMNCLNYVKHKYNYPIDEIYEREPGTGKCSLFGNQNMVTGEIKYEDALLCRMDKTKCGVEGKYYV